MKGGMKPLLLLALFFLFLVKCQKFDTFDVDFSGTTLAESFNITVFSFHPPAYPVSLFNAPYDEPILICPCIGCQESMGCANGTHCIWPNMGYEMSLGLPPGKDPLYQLFSASQIRPPPLPVPNVRYNLGKIWSSSARQLRTPSNLDLTRCVVQLSPDLIVSGFRQESIQCNYNEMADLIRDMYQVIENSTLTPGRIDFSIRQLAAFSLKEGWIACMREIEHLYFSGLAWIPPMQANPDLEIRGTKDCYQPYGTPEWASDPCCNPAGIASGCCIARDVRINRSRIPSRGINEDYIMDVCQSPSDANMLLSQYERLVAMKTQCPKANTLAPLAMREDFVEEIPFLQSPEVGRDFCGYCFSHNGTCVDTGMACSIPAKTCIPPNMCSSTSECGPFCYIKEVTTRSECEEFSSIPWNTLPLMTYWDTDQIANVTGICKILKNQYDCELEGYEWFPYRREVCEHSIEPIYGCTDVEDIDPGGSCIIPCHFNDTRLGCKSSADPCPFYYTRAQNQSACLAQGNSQQWCSGASPYQWVIQYNITRGFFTASDSIAARRPVNPGTVFRRDEYRRSVADRYRPYIRDQLKCQFGIQGKMLEIFACDCASGIKGADCYSGFGIASLTRLEGYGKSFTSPFVHAVSWSEDPLAIGVDVSAAIRSDQARSDGGMDGIYGERSVLSPSAYEFLVLNDLLTESIGQILNVFGVDVDIPSGFIELCLSLDDDIPIQDFQYTIPDFGILVVNETTNTTRIVPQELTINITGLANDTYCAMINTSGVYYPILRYDNWTLAEADGCGIFYGNGSEFTDCNGTPCGNATLDQCGVCEGNGTSCLDCNGNVNGTATLDFCGVCGGDNSTCIGCDGVYNSNATLDACGECGGNASVAVYDECGVCNGDNTTCMGCDGIPNSGLQNDHCGVCGGDGTSCVVCDCFGTINGTAQLDACNVCDGDNSTCTGCDGVVNSGMKFDLCGVCGGNNSTCGDCNGTPNGPVRPDQCGVCFGTNDCVDCLGVVNGSAVVDICGVCNGGNLTCVGCNGVAQMFEAKYDACGVCGGNGTTCTPDPMCMNISCNNNGLCVGGICRCFHGWLGLYCDEEDMCHDSNGNLLTSCSGNGVCNSTTGDCDCDPGYSDFLCSTYDPCQDGSVNCHNGTCVPFTGACVCSPGYAGCHCTERDCGENGFYSPIDDLCKCLPGYSGPTCDDCDTGTDANGNVYVCIPFDASFGSAYLVSVKESLVSELGDTLGAFTLDQASDNAFTCNCIKDPPSIAIRDPSDIPGGQYCESRIDDLNQRIYDQICRLSEGYSVIGESIVGQFKSVVGPECSVSRFSAALLLAILSVTAFFISFIYALEIWKAIRSYFDPPPYVEQKKQQ